MRIGELARTHLSDPQLALLVLAMTLFGISMVYSAGVVDVPGSVAAGIWRRQIVWLGLALAAFILMLRIETAWLGRIALPIYLATLLLLVATLFVGTGVGTATGTRRWIQVGPMVIQPPQFANIATVLLLAKVLGSWRSPPATIWKLWLPILIALVPMALVIAQPDLGTALVFGPVLLGALYWAGVPAMMLLLLVSPLIGLLLAFQPTLFSAYMVLLTVVLLFYRPRISEAAGVVGANLAMGTIAYPIWDSLATYQKNRILVFLDPYIDPAGAGYQLIQSQVAIGSGGLVGKGFLEGTQKRLAFLPEQHTDFIFAVIGEELGYIGGVAVVLGFALILWRLVRLAERSADPFRGILIFGVFSTWLTHVFINIGMTIGLVPITGIPLPFISYGGSFLLATWIAHGMAQRAARRARDHDASPLR